MESGLEDGVEQDLHSFSRCSHVSDIPSTRQFTQLRITREVVHFFADGHVSGRTRGSRKMFRISQGWIGLIEGVDVSFTLGMGEQTNQALKKGKY